MRKTRHIENGVTIVEIMVVLSVFVTFSALTFGAMRAYDISTTMSITKSRLSAQANLALNKMREELTQSKAALVSRAGTTPDALTFQIRTGLDGEQNIIWGDGVTADQDLEYYIDNSGIPANQLKRRLVIPGTETVLASYISDLQFALSENSVTIGIVASRDAQRGYIPALTVGLSTEVDFRN